MAGNGNNYTGLKCGEVILGRPLVGVQGTLHDPKLGDEIYTAYIDPSGAGKSVNEIPISGSVQKVAPTDPSDPNHPATFRGGYRVGTKGDLVGQSGTPGGPTPTADALRGNIRGLASQAVAEVDSGKLNCPVLKSLQLKQ